MKETLGRVDGVGPFAHTQPDPAAQGASSVGLNADGAHSSTRAGAGSWDESSWELCRGLVVSEGLPGDVDLDEWLEAMLHG